MRIGILTFHFADNYGAVVQAYATQKFLTQQGHDAQIINYQPTYMTHGGSFRFPSSRTNLLINAQILFIRLANLRSRLQPTSANFYKEFRKNHLRLTPQVFTTFEQLQQHCPPFDAYICGSDQIWNPPLRFGIDPAYFADFAPSTAKRIAFAASFGRSNIEPHYHTSIASLLNKMHHIGIREPQGIQFASSLTSKPLHLTPDPTILLQDYSDVIIPPNYSSPYLFTYVLCGDALINDIQSYASQQLKVPAYTPWVLHQRWKLNAKQVPIGPARWLGHIQNSRFVVTNSFHGTLFCILLQKPFISVSLTGSRQPLSVRLTALLERLGLSDRFVDRVDTSTINKLINTVPDWNQVKTKLAAWRDEGIAFLTQSLMACFLAFC